MVLLRSGGLPVLSIDEGIETTRQRQLSVCEEVNRTDVVSNACSYVVVGELVLYVFVALRDARPR